MLKIFSAILLRFPKLTRHKLHFFIILVIEYQIVFLMQNLEILVFEHRHHRVFLCLTVEISSCVLGRTVFVSPKLLFQKHSLSLLYAQSSFVFNIAYEFSPLDDSASFL